VSGPLELRPALPALIVAGTGLALLLAQAFSPRGIARRSSQVAILGLVGALWATLAVAPTLPSRVGLAGVLYLDAFAAFFHVLILGCGVVAFLLSPAYFEDAGGDRGEYYALACFSIVGMLGLVSARELISLFIALEIMSVSLYALVGIQRDRPAGLEAALKYFVTGAFASAFLLYGVAFLYGATGSTSLVRIGRALARPEGDLALMALVGTGLLLVGFGFKIASAPFHMWAPDVYQGAPTPVTGFMAAAVKVAALGAMLQVLGVALGGLAADWRAALALLALLTMVLGNLGALAQENVKRMLAFSSIAHAGYLLTGLVAPIREAGTAVLFYLAGYAAVSLAGFGTLAALARGGREPSTLDDLAGLAARRPWLAAGFTLVLISLTGVPISAGFVGKFFLFRAAVQADYTILAVVGVLTSVISAYYYLRVVVAMYMRPPAGDDPWARVTHGAALGLALSAAIVIGLGVYPGPLLELAREAALTIR
jgi:NADH-quinone oxidoreductase subunit N